MTSWWAWLRLKSPVSRLFALPFIQAGIKENIKAPRHWPLTDEFPAQRASNAEDVSIWWRHRDFYIHATSIPQGQWPVCEVILIFTLGLLYISSFNLVGIAFTRYFSIRYPLKFIRLFTHRVASVAVAAVWVTLTAIACGIYIRKEPRKYINVPVWLPIRAHYLTHWGPDKMIAISQTTFSNAFSSMKMLILRLKFHWSLLPYVKLAIFQHWFR